MLQVFGSTTIEALEQTAVFTEKRHEVLAGNIANLSTPDYRARDLDVDTFQQALAESIRDRQHGPSDPGRDDWELFPGQGAALSLGDRNNSHRPTDSVTSSARDDDFVGPRSASEAIVYHDESDVSLESQVTKIAKNKHMHNLAIATMRNQFELLRAAITERA